MVSETTEFVPVAPGEDFLTILYSIPWTSDSLRELARDPFHDPIPSWIAGLHSPDAEVRTTAALLLEEIPSPRALPALISALHDPDAAVRYHVIDTLTAIGSRTTVDALLPLANDADRDVRGNVAWGLGRLGVRAAEVTTTLIQLLNDDFWAVRCFAAESLCLVGDVSAVPAIRAALPDTPAVRVWLWYALTLLDKESFPLTQCLQLFRQSGNVARIQIARVLERVATLETAPRIAATTQRILDQNPPVSVAETLEELLTALNSLALVRTQ